MKVSTISGKKIPAALRYLIAGVLWIAVWELLCRIVAEPTVLVSPLETARRIGELGQTAVFWRICLRSILSILLGYVCGIAVGALFAVASRLTVARTMLSPLLYVVRATPVASFILLTYFWMQSDNIPAFISFLMVLPVIWGNVRQGLEGCDRGLLEMAKVYGFSRKKTLWQIRLPAALPYFLAGCRTALGLAWKAGVAAQALVRPEKTIGNELQNAKIALETVDIFAWTVIVILLSLLLEWLVMLVFEKLLKGGKRA